MAKRTYANNINQMKLMLAGVKNNAEMLKTRGINEDYIGRLEAGYGNAQKLDNEQEKLKADLKSKTAELETAMKTGMQLHAETKRLVKMTIPKEQWREFGIEDKR